MSRPLAVVALLLVAAWGVVGVPTGSGATFVAGSQNAASVSAAADWTAPTVSVRNPGSPVKDTVTVTADASDAETGVASVVIQVLAPGGSAWTTLCTATAAPYSCAWSTRAGVDGTYAVRAVATDRAGYATTSDSVATIVANNLLVVLTSPGDIVRGTVPLTATLYNAGAVGYTVRIEYAVAGTTSWRTLCTAPSTAPYTCTWTTTGSGFTQGESYDLRAVATAGSSTTSSTVVPDVMVDNVAPAVTMLDPGAVLRGTVTLAANATDNESGVASVELQHQRSGSASWTTACTIGTDPWSCRFDTTRLLDGTYSFRALATDAAGLVTISVPVTGRAVDNTVSSVSMEDPGAFLTGTVALAATGSSTAGVSSVRIDRAPSGTTTWTAVCTDTTAPYSCSWDTTTVPDGLYDFRAVLVDGNGVTTVSTTVTGRRVDSSPLRGYDVQAANGGASGGRLDTGDVLRLTYTDQVNLGTITPGWTGAALPVTLRLRDGNALGLGSKNDSVDVLRNGAAVNVGAVNLRGDFIKTNKSVTYNATLTAVATTVNGVPATQVVVTVGTMASGSGLRTSTTTGTMSWTPSAGATSLAGRPCSTAPTAELGVLDREL